MVPVVLSKEEIEALPLTGFGGKIILVRDKQQVGTACAELEQSGVLGFDTETRPAFRKGRKNRVSLLQLAAGDRVYLFRLNYLGLPEPLLRLLSDPSVKKVGAAIHEDLRKLRELKPFQADGFIDLQQMAKLNGIQGISLRKMAAIYLGVRISKSQQLTNWENPDLTEGQMRYAATDAWVCRLIYQKMLEHGPVRVPRDNP